MERGLVYGEYNDCNLRISWHQVHKSNRLRPYREVQVLPSLLERAQYAGYLDPSRRWDRPQKWPKNFRSEKRKPISFLEMAQQNSNEPLADLTQLGQANGSGDKRALYLKLFSGEMFKGFQRNTIARDLVMKRTLTSGKSMQFIFTGRTSAEYHTPGNSILGNGDGAPPVAEKTVTVDDLLISSAFVYELDETLAHYDLRGEISRKIGYALAEKYDRKIFRAVTKACLLYTSPSPRDRG